MKRGGLRGRAIRSAASGENTLAERSQELVWTVDMDIDTGREKKEVPRRGRQACARLHALKCVKAASSTGHRNPVGGSGSARSAQRCPQGPAPLQQTHLPAGSALVSKNKNNNSPLFLSFHYSYFSAKNEKLFRSV